MNENSIRNNIPDMQKRNTKHNSETISPAKKRGKGMAQSGTQTSDYRQPERVLLGNYVKMRW